MEAGGITQDGPTGEAMREVPSKLLWWNVTEWISETGTLYRRIYNPVRKEWVWGDAVTPILRRQQPGYRIRGEFRTIEQSIALAWVPRRAGMKRMRAVTFREPAHGPVAHNLRYVDQSKEGDDDESSDSEEEEDDMPGEVWRPLVCKIGVVPCGDIGFAVSNFGRIRLPSGAVYTGFKAVGRFCPVPNTGMVPIDATRVLFGASRTEKPPPRIRNLLLLLKNANDVSIEGLSRRMSLKQSTVWAYVQHGMRYTSTDTSRRILHRLLSKTQPFEHAMRDVVSRNPGLLTMHLGPLVEIITRELAGDPDWRCNRFRHAEVAALRMLLQREA
jgi:hypothetical protein